MYTRLTLIFLLATLMLSCQKPIVFPEGAGPGGKGNPGSGSESNTGNALFYFKGTLNGAPINWEVTDGRTWSNGTTLRSELNNVGIITGSQGGTISTIRADFEVYPQIEIEFRTMQVSTLDEHRYDYLKSFVTTGIWQFDANEDLKVGTKAIIIRYIDKNNKEYTSLGAQNGHIITIDKVTATPAELGIPAGLDVKVSWSCTLYPYDGTGSPLTLTKAEALVHLEDRW